MSWFKEQISAWEWYVVYFWSHTYRSPLRVNAPMDFLFKYGCSIQDVEHQCGMKFIRYFAPLKPATSYEAPVPSKNTRGKYINLLPLKDYPCYGTYDMDVVPVAQNISHYIEVMKLKSNTGISYEIVDWINSQVVCIETRDFGKQQILCGFNACKNNR